MVLKRCPDINTKMFKDKVLLIYPGTVKSQTKRMPLSILYLAESLININYEPVLLDLQVEKFHPELLKDIICVGISTLTGKQITYGLDVAQKIREVNPDIPIVWGGIHPSIAPRQTIFHLAVDYIVYGEGEVTFQHLVKALASHKNVDNIQGLVHIKNDKIIINPRRPFINFNKYNKLPYDLLPLSRYQTSDRFEYQSSRGCPFGCAFCYNKQFNFFKWRFKDSRIVLDELEYIKKRFNSTYLYLVDDEFFISKKRAFEIIKGLIERKIIFKWKPAIRVDMVNRFTAEDFDLLEKSGCFEFCMGAESGSNRVLKYINKKITKKDILTSCNHTININITPQYSFMAGFPTETIKEFHETLDCISRLWDINRKIKVNGLYLAAPFPGTDIFNTVSRIKGYSSPGTLDEWGKIDVMYPQLDFPYIPEELYKQIRVYMVIVRFIFLWMHSGSFLKEFKNWKSLKYYKFILFKILFFPFYFLFKFRFKRKFIIFPIDIHIIRSTIFKMLP